MKFSRRITGIKPSATLTLNAQAQQLREQGQEIISLAVGEPDFSTPAHVRSAAKEAIEQGFTRYTPVPGIMELREAVAQYFVRNYGASCNGHNTIVSNGGKQCLYNLLQCLLNPGDEVLVPAPYWVSYPAMIELAGGVPVYIQTEPEQDFLLSVDRLLAKITDKTKILLLNTPSNPTGGHYTQAQLDALVRAALDKGLFIIADEIYDQLVYLPAQPASASVLWSKFPEQIAVVNGLAKSFAMTGWRIGYCLAHEDLIKAMSKLQSQSSSNICSVAQKAALAALTGSWEEVARMREAFRKRRDFAFDKVQNWPGVMCSKPQGAFYLFPKVSDLYNARIPDSGTLCSFLLAEAGVALVPGVAFGDDRCIRISYALDEKTLGAALDKTGAVLRKVAGM